MAKEKTVYVCSDCGGSSPKWLGKCPSCNAWNTLIESVPESNAPTKNRFASLAKTAEVVTLGDGIVEGGVVPISGDSGICKSTLLLQALDSLQRSGQNTCYFKL